MTFLHDMNAKYFDGGLSPQVMDLMDSINRERPEVQEWVDRMCRQMQKQRFAATDFNQVKAWVLGAFLSKILPGAWGGSVPPITADGRHALIDDYMEKNRWCGLEPGNRFLDLGCGFPPTTTMDSGRRFPDVHITGADPSFGHYLVRETSGDYACFNEDEELLYFQGDMTDPERWDYLYDNPEMTRRRFSDHLSEMLPSLSGDPDQFASVEQDGVTLSRNPVLEFTTDRLSFTQLGIGSDGLGTFEVVRCFNVLCYFDRPFRDRALEWLPSVLGDGGIFLAGMDWTRTRHTRMAVYQNVNGRMVPREFAFSIENIRPIEMITWFAMHDDDYDLAALAETVGTIRADSAFRQEFDGRMDELMGEIGYCARGDDGYLGTVEESMMTSELLDSASETVGQALESEGFAERAAEVLRTAGHDAWVNSVGHVAVNPATLDLS